MAPVHESLVFAAHSNSTSWTCTGPPVVNEGDLLLLYLNTDDGQLANTGDALGSPTWPSGFQAIDPGVNHSAGTPNPDTSGYLAYKVATAGDVATGTGVNYTVGWTNNSQGGYCFTRTSGVDTANPIDASSYAVTGNNATSITLPGITTTVPDTRLYGFFGVDESNTGYDPYWAEPPITGWTSLLGTSSTPSGQGSSSTYMGVATTTQVSAGATGDKVANIDSQNDAISGRLVAIRPAATGGTPVGLAVETDTAFDITTGGLRLGSWRFFSDVASPGAGDALAAENTVPTISQAQIENGIVRLRFQLINSAASPDTQQIQVQYSEDGTNWNTIASQSPAGDTEVFWVRWDDGASTVGATIASQLLAGTTSSGVYVEDSGTSITAAASATTEHDLALQIHWPPPDTTIKLRLLWNGTPVELAGATEIELATPGPSQRSHTIDRLTAIPGIIRNQENRFAPDRRHFWDPVRRRWWFFTGDGSETPSGQLRYYTWDGSGAWSGPTAFSVGAGALTGGLHKVHMQQVADGEMAVLVVTRQSSSTRYWRRGRVTSSTAITWDTGDSNASYSDRHVAVGMDDGYHWWIGGIDAVSGGVWAQRSTNPDGGASGWTSGFGTRHTAADSGVASGDLISIYGLASGKALVVWANAGTGALRYALCDGTTGFGSVRSIAGTAHPNDWGVVRSGGWVYCTHTDSISDSSGNWVGKAYQESDDATGFAAITSPGQSHTSAGGNDGLPLSAFGDDIYTFAVWSAFEGGQDRNLRYRKYTGPGRSGSWGALTEIIEGGRTNFDYNLSSQGHGAGKIVVITLAGDDALLGTQFALEYHTLTVATEVELDQAVETDTAFDLATGQAVAVDQAVETDVAQDLSASKTVPLEIAVETDAGLDVTVTKAATLDLAVETDVAQDVTASKTSAIELAVETDVAQDLAGSKTVALDLAVETDSAFNITAGLTHVIDVDQAVETDSALDVTLHWDLNTPSRGAFYYPWFPETWTVGGEPIKYTPTLGLYDLDSGGAAAVYDQHIAWMEQAGIELVILSWWAQDDGNPNLKGTDHNEGTRIPLFLSRLVAAGSKIRVCMYYEEEGFSDPSVSQLQDDLDYIATNYGSHPNYLWRDGKPVIFVYNSGDTSSVNCLQRWSDATNGYGDWYVVMKVFGGYAAATPPPSSWHQYGPATRESVHSPYSHVISAGYWQANDPDPPGGEFPYLARDVDAYAAAVRNMVAADTFEWHLVTTFNEWGEGTAVEPADEFGTIYLELLGTDGTLILQAAETDIAQDVTASKMVALDLAVETDTAFELGSAQVVAVEQAVETDAAQDLGAAKTVAVELASETDVALDPVVSRQVVTDLALETDAAQDVTASKTVVAELALEVDSAQDITGAVGIPLDLATEIDAAQDIAASKAPAVELAVEDDFAFELGAGQSGTVQLATEVDVALDIGPSRRVAVDLAQEADAAFDLGASRSAGVDQAIEAGAAFDITASKTVAADLAAESDVAQDLAASKIVALDQAAETDTAFDVAASLAGSLDLAIESDIGQDLAASKVVALDQAAETATGLDLVPAKSVALDLALETDAAQEITQPGINLVEQAVETDAAQDVAASKTVALDQAVETDIALDVIVVLGGELDQAVETDAAQDVAASKTVVLDQASETELAWDIVAARTVPVDLATEIDTAQEVTGIGGVLLDVAVETATAFDIVAAKSRALDLAAETDVALDVGGGTRVDIDVTVVLGERRWSGAMTGRRWTATLADQH